MFYSLSKSKKKFACNRPSVKVVTALIHTSWIVLSKLQDKKAGGSAYIQCTREMSSYRKCPFGTNINEV